GRPVHRQGSLSRQGVRSLGRVGSRAPYHAHTSQDRPILLGPRPRAAADGPPLQAHDPVPRGAAAAPAEAASREAGRRLPPRPHRQAAAAAAARAPRVRRRRLRRAAARAAAAARHGEPAALRGRAQPRAAARRGVARGAADGDRRPLLQRGPG
ncbi:MAG: hypothetical protein J3K34DRAFT_519750, partial [Monoraphidium minutum]